METAVVVLNAASLLLFAISLVLVVTHTPGRFRRDTGVFLACMILIFIFVNFSNILEHLHIADILDYYEDYAEMLFPLVFVMLLNSIRLHADIEKLKKTEADLDLMLRERSELLMEIHHRVKNNLQIVISIINLQRNREGVDQNLDRILADTAGRIHSMAAVHEVIYNAKYYSDIPAAEFILDIVKNAESIHARDRTGRIETDFNIDAAIRFRLEMAIPVGMLVNELVTNTYRHAFPSGRSGKLVVSLRKERHSTCLEVRDDGIGISEDMMNENRAKMGSVLIRNLVSQVNGTIQYETGPGTDIRILFST